MDRLAIESGIFKGSEFAPFKITTRGKYGGIYVSPDSQGFFMPKI